MKLFKILAMALLTSLPVAAFSQDTAGQVIKMHKHKSEKMKYTCPMHPEVISGKPGKCPRCGMDMKMMAKEKTAGLYSCPVHPEVMSDKPGKCPECGTALSLSLKEKMKMEVMKIYSCPLHPDVTSNKPGKCSRCGTDLKAKEEGVFHQD
jgi:uncharacterized paraquat-inducible protein A